MKTKLLIAGLLFCLGSKLVSQNGEQLFKANCAVCHTVGKGKLTGPDLKDVDKRHEAGWLLKWIKSSQTLVKSGDQEAVTLFNENNSLVMPDVALAEDEIKSILAFVKEKSETPVAPVTAAAAESKSALVEHVCGSSLYNMFGFPAYIMLFMIGLLLIVLWVMVLVIKSLSRELKLTRTRLT